MKTLKIILLIILFIFLINGCRTFINFSPSFSPKMIVNSKQKDTIVKKDTIEIKK